MYFFDVTGRQIHDARELLGLSRHELGARSGVSRLTLRLWEASGDEPPNALAPNLSRVLRYLQGEGVQFGDGGGVHLGPPAPTLKGAQPSEDSTGGPMKSTSREQRQFLQGGNPSSARSPIRLRKLAVGGMG
jgi:transcriptional regulator with XRE-family HTH domain